MKYTIDTTMPQQSVFALKSLISNEPISLYIDSIGDHSLTVKFCLMDRDLFVINHSATQEDGDAYPEIWVVDEYKSNPNWVKIKEHAPIMGIKIVRDELSWFYEGKEWHVITDSAIVLSFPDEDMAIIALDSIAGLIQILPKGECMTKEKYKVTNHWSFKSDVFDRISRTMVALE